MEGLRASWEGLGSKCKDLGTYWEGLGSSWKGLRSSWKGLGSSWESLRASWEALKGGGRGPQRRLRGLQWQLGGRGVSKVAGKHPRASSIAGEITAIDIANLHRQWEAWEYRCTSCNSGSSVRQRCVFS